MKAYDGGLGELDNGINWGTFKMRDKPSTVAHERRYQEGIACTDHRFPKGKGGRWLQLAMDPNMGVEYYPDLFSLFQVLPLGVDKTLIKLACYSPPNLSADEREMQKIADETPRRVKAGDATGAPRRSRCPSARLRSRT